MRKGMLAAALALSLPAAAFASGPSLRKSEDEKPRRDRITKPHQGAKEMARRRRQMERNK